MTRYARAGNTQKHQKMPMDPTPWNELSMGIKKSLKSKKIKTEHNKEETVIDVSNDAVKNIKDASSKKKLKKLELMKVQKSDVVSEVPNQSEMFDSDDKEYTQENISNKQFIKDLGEIVIPKKNELIIEKPSSKRQRKKFKYEERKKQKTKLITELAEYSQSQSADDSNDTQEDILGNPSESNEDCTQALGGRNEKSITEKPMSKRQLKKLKREKRSNQNDQLNTESPDQTLDESSSVDHSKKTDSFKILRKKELFKQRLLKKREEKGIPLLAPNVERRLYLIKKRLREKGFAPEQVKDIMRKERRKAEVEFRKTYTKKTCFNCRQSGHILADCPVSLGGSNQETGMCYKCGSMEHVSYKCPKKISGYPLATCFICKAQGHISRECPNNTHGIYPKGGKCHLCGNINHLKKDCPSLIKKEEETSIRLHTINEGRSIDDEITEFKSEVTVKNELKKPKIVKF